MLGLRPAAEPLTELDSIPKFSYMGYFGKLAVCGLNVYEGPDGMVFIVTELPDNEGTSITNRAEMVAETLEAEYGLPHVFGEPRDVNYTYIEHYPVSKRRGDFPENFSIVTFAGAPPLHSNDSNPKFYSEPNWVPVEREQVERLIGAPFMGVR
jgi:hypothetical protein